MTFDSEPCRIRDRAHLWHPYTRRSAMERAPFPIIVRGDGPYLFDSEGRRYLDAVSSWWCCNLGHSHPRIVEAIRKQAAELQHSILGNLSHPGAVELAAALADLMPEPSCHVLFASDGASAVEAALKIALQYWHQVGQPARKVFVSLKEAYHGDTLGAVGVGFLPHFHQPFAALLPATHRAESPCCGTCAHGKSPESCALECFASMEEILRDRADELAAVIVEPLCQGAAGMRIYSARYLRRLYDLCKEKNVLLIADEIAVGFGRTGRMFAFEHADIAPDIVCLGKGLSAGYLPLSATVVSDRIYDTFTDRPGDHTFYHGHTFSGNPIACAAAVETLNVYREENIPARAAGLGGILERRMGSLRALPGVRDVRCLGMIGAVELGRFPGDPEGARIARLAGGQLAHEGILVRPLGNVVYLMLPLITPPDVLAHAVERLRDAIARSLSPGSPASSGT